jgi:hypothetical protein
MPVCIHCSTPCPSLFTLYSSSYALRECSHCHCLADELLENSFTVKFLQLLLLSAPVLRHLIYNDDEKAQLEQQSQRKRLLPPDVRLGLACILIDACEPSRRLEKVHLMEFKSVGGPTPPCSSLKKEIISFCWTSCLF